MPRDTAILSDVAKAFGESDADALRAKLGSDKSLNAIEEELDRGLSLVNTRKFDQYDIESLLAGPQNYDDLLETGSAADLPIEERHIGKAVLRMIFNLDYAVFKCRKVELQTVRAALKYLQYWVYQSPRRSKRLGMGCTTDGRRGRKYGIDIEVLYSETQNERLRKCNEIATRKSDKSTRPTNMIKLSDNRRTSAKDPDNSKDKSDDHATTKVSCAPGSRKSKLPRNDIKPNISPWVTRSQVVRQVVAPIEPTSNQATSSRALKLGVLRDDVLALQRTVDGLEEKQLQTQKELEKAETKLESQGQAVCKAVEELCRADEKLKKAETSEAEAQRTADALEAEASQSEREVQRAKEILDIKRSILRDYEDART